MQRSFVNQPIRPKLRPLYIGFILLILIMIAGTWGFCVIEHYTLLEAFFMTIITLSTVGYGTLHELSQEGMLFTGLLIIFSFGIFAYVISSLTRYILDGNFRNYLMQRKVIKQIENLKDHVIVCGFGRNGKQATQELLDHNEAVIVVENESNVIQEMGKQKKLIFVNGNATRDEVLEGAGIERAKALITTLPNDADNLFVVLTAREKNATMTIISRASEDHSDIKLRRAGATNVIMPDKVGGVRMAKLVSQPDVIEFIEAIMIRSGTDVNIEEISCAADIHSCYINKTISELNIRQVSGANLIGMKTDGGEYVFNPAPDIKLKPDYKLFALGTIEQINKLKEVLLEKKK